jgi:TolB-like protein
LSFIAELKRRNVFRVGVAYAVAAWLVAQVIEIAADSFSAPEWVMQMLLTVLLLGLPVALILAWALELTPEGIKREKDVDRSTSITPRTGKQLNNIILVLMALAIAYLLFDKFNGHQMPRGEQVSNSTQESSQRPQQSTAQGDANSTAPGPDAKASPSSTDNSVAVLPFVNMSSDPEQEYFSDGITEEIINALVKIPGLSVPARTTVFAFKGERRDVRKIGGELGVAHVLEGSIRSQGKQVRITAQLIKVDDGFHLWSETFDRQLDNIFVVQEEIATAIAEVLTGELGMGVKAVPHTTRNMEAYDSYLQGRALLHQRGGDSLEKAVELFTRTTEMDPQFAPAWAAMALTYSVMDNIQGMEEKAIETAKHALKLDPNNVDALDALGSAYRDSWRWAEAEPVFERAMAIDPQSAELLEDYAEFLAIVGRFDGYLAIAEKGYALNPRLGPLADAYVWALMKHGKYEKANEVIEQWNRSVTAGDKVTWWDEPFWKMAPALASGDTTAAIELAQQLGPVHMKTETRDAIIALLESPSNTQARDILRAVVSESNLEAYDFDAYIAKMVLSYSGDIDFLVEDMISFYQENPHGNLEDIWSPIYTPVRQHPRFEVFLKLTGLPEYWDQAGWPDACQRKGDGSIDCQ